MTLIDARQRLLHSFQNAIDNRSVTYNWDNFEVEMIVTVLQLINNKAHFSPPPPPPKQKYVDIKTINIFFTWLLYSFFSNRKKNDYLSLLNIIALVYTYRLLFCVKIN